MHPRPPARRPQLHLAGGLLLALLVLGAAARAAPEPAPTTPEATAPSWSFQVDARELAQGLLTIELSLRGYQGPLLLCADMRGAGKSVLKPRALAGTPPRETMLARDAEKSDCFDAVAPQAGPLRVRYQVDLGDLARHHGDPDWAARAGDDFVFNDESVLLRPDPLPDAAAIEIDFQLPPGVSVAAPWKQLDRDGRRFASDARQYDAGSYVAIGKLHPLRAVESHGGRFEVFALGAPRVASDAALDAWVGRAARAVGDFYRGVPTGRAMVYLMPVAGQREGGVFGSTLNRATPSAVLFFGADAPDSAFDDDWMATHELFHVGNPRLARRVHWFNEGAATYYQDVLRARAGMVAPEVIWSDLYDGFRRFCSPEDGRSLGDESEHLRERHRYTRVYWGGACLFFCADVLIREHSAGTASLDDLLRALRAKSELEPLDEEELLAALDEAAGTPMLSAMLRATEPTPLEPLLRKLGLVPVAPDKVTLDDAAPEAGLRRAILEATSTPLHSSGSRR